MDQSTTLASPAGAPWAASLSTTRETALTGPIAGADGCDAPCSNGPPTPLIRLWSARSEGRWFRSWPRTTARYNLARTARNGRRAGAPVETAPPRIARAPVFELPFCRDVARQCRAYAPQTLRRAAGRFCCSSQAGAPPRRLKTIASPRSRSAPILTRRWCCSIATQRCIARRPSGASIRRASPG